MNTLFPVNFSSSMLSEVHRCRLSWFRRYVQHYNPSGVNSDLYAGGLFASACEATRKAFYNEGMTEEAAIAIGKDLILSADNIPDGIKTNERTAFVFEKYFKYFSNSEILPAKLVDGTHAIEYTFEIDTGIPHPDLPDRTIKFTGKLDLVGTYSRNGKEEFFVVDEKTTKAVYRVPGTKIPDLEKIRAEYLCRGQFIGYVYACRKLGLPVTKTIVRKVPIMSNYEEPFEVEIDCNEAQLKWWEQSTFSVIEELVERYKYWKESQCDFRSLFIPIYNEGCHSWGRLCAYNQGCTVPEGDELLHAMMPQMVSYPLVDTPTPLVDYLEQVKAKESEV